jgi:heat shock protein HtpX
MATASEANAGAALRNTDFRRAIAQNKRATVAFTIMLLWLSAIFGYILGWALGILIEIWTVPDAKVAQLTLSWVIADLGGPPRPQALLCAAGMLSLSAIWGIFTLAIGGSILAAFSGARDADARRPGEQRFINVVQEMAVAAGLPPPRTMVIDSPALNAFASGTSPGRAIITATTGLIRTCTREELQGVVGHEMAHVANYDVRYVTLVAAMAGVIVLVGHLMWDMLRYELGLTEREQYVENDPEATQEEALPIGPVGLSPQRLLLSLGVVVIAATAALVAPIAARLVQFAISREREYEADATSVQFTRNPLGLIGALHRLADADTAIARDSSPVSALCIASPSALTDGPFSTHPPIEDRIHRLQNLGGTPTPTSESAVSEHASAPVNAPAT